ncbi:MAG: FtsX-like permease family protein [Candidatus Nitrohelix vancouverensis]|uniref:FtsX-like permease family protein n=1 Tax=Candidatus Nitrohelix vancouverensis TaxID=2705534 RepID=A0A7T0G3B1_9BACT|nr:MAG: FtsX-like permease family protein [Candidatus Nitrohelix vancouverensis]
MTYGTLPLRQLFRLALAECRGASARLSFFILCIAIGVGAVTVINSFTLTLQNSIQNESKGLLAADIEIKSSWAMSAKDEQILRKELGPEAEFLSIKELHAMARFPDPAKPGENGSILTELKAVPTEAPYYPLYGEFEAKPGKALEVLLEDSGAVVETSFLARTHLKAGDTFDLGKSRVTIRGIVISEPDRLSRAFSIGPRLFVSLKTLDASELIQPGSRVRHKTLVRLADSSDPEIVAFNIEHKLSDKAASTRTYKDRKSNLAQSIDRIGRYLGSIAVVALLMGGIGVAMIVRVFMAQKLDSAAIMKCLGARSRTIWNIYLLQALGLGLLGSILGAAAGYGFQFLLPAKLAGLLAIEVKPEFYWEPTFRAIILGLGTTLLFCAWPLLCASRVKPLRLFRRGFDDEHQPNIGRRERIAAGFAFTAGLIALSIWQAGSVKNAAVFLAAILVAILLSMGSAFLVVRLLKKYSWTGTVSGQYGLANLHRPNNQTLPIVACLGMGVMLLLTVRLTQMDMMAMLSSNTENSPPNYFFIDIQSDQTEQFTQALDSVAPEAERSLTPLVRSKFYSANGVKAQDWKFDNPAAEEWFINREFVLTHMSDAPPPDNEIIKGKWWGKEGASTPQVSLEEDAARRLNIDVGATLTMEIQGVQIEAPVTNIRKVNWRNMRTNFYMIYSPSALEGAPLTFVATAHVPEDKEMEVQRAVVNSLPNVTALSSRDIVKTVQNITEKLSALVDFMSGFSILSGLIILSGSIASTKYRRMQESAILKILGARRFAVARILGVEYALLGLLAGMIGAGLSALLSWGVMEYLVKAPWHFYPSVTFSAIFLTAVAAAVTGIVSSLDSLNGKPGKTLREAT